MRTEKYNSQIKPLIWSMSSMKSTRMLPQTWKRKRSICILSSGTGWSRLSPQSPMEPMKIFKTYLHVMKRSAGGKCQVFYYYQKVFSPKS